MKTNPYFKIATLLLLFIFLGCQKDKINLIEDENAEVINEVKQDVPVSTYIKGDNIPDVLNHLASKTNSTYSKISDLNGKIRYNRAKIILNHALEVVTKGDNTNYSFDIFLDDMPKYEFYSLIVSKTEEGIIQEPFIIGYKMTKDDYENYLAHDFNFRHFKAT